MWTTMIFLCCCCCSALFLFTSVTKTNICFVQLISLSWIYSVVSVVAAAAARPLAIVTQSSRLYFMWYQMSERHFTFFSLGSTMWHGVVLYMCVCMVFGVAAIMWEAECRKEKRWQRRKLFSYQALIMGWNNGKNKQIHGSVCFLCLTGKVWAVCNECAYDDDEVERCENNGNKRPLNNESETLERVATSLKRSEFDRKWHWQQKNINENENISFREITFHTKDESKKPKMSSLNVLRRRACSIQLANACRPNWERLPYHNTLRTLEYEWASVFIFILSLVFFPPQLLLLLLFIADFVFCICRLRMFLCFLWH